MRTVALAGNPNVGKSTLFNELTGLSQHTGNWTGKTVDSAEGKFYYKYNDYKVIDLPGTYSLISNSAEEEIARNFICFSEYDVVVCVVDSTNLERNLNLVLQVLELTDNVILMLNISDEAKKKNIEINEKLLSQLLGIPVVKATARSGKGINALLEEIHLIATNSKKNNAFKLSYINPIEQGIRIISKELPELKVNKRFIAIKLMENNESFNESLKRETGFDYHNSYRLERAVNRAEEVLIRFNLEKEGFINAVTSQILTKARETARLTVKKTPSKKDRFDERLDRVFMSKITGIPIMLLILGFIMWLTVSGSNYPSLLLKDFFDFVELKTANIMLEINVPSVVVDCIVHGILKVLFWVIAVMLPPMAIFFPLFALAEDFGLLPRIAFNLDSSFEKCNACGKQALTTCMGYGCNAVGVTGARIIDSPRERLIAIITNSLTPCNGRFPSLIAMISMFFVSNSFFSSLILLTILVLSMAGTLLSSKILSKTVLKGVPSSFVMEIPPYRKPRFLKVIGESIKDRIVFVLLRAAAVAAPAGLLIWLMANIKTANGSVLTYCAALLDPIGRFLGLDGVIILSFILGFPANEIVIPIMLMAYLAGGTLTDYSSLEGLKEILVANGWSITTAICFCVFCLFHFPCSTTLLTVYKETKSIKWTAMSFFCPLVLGTVCCSIINAVT